METASLQNAGHEYLIVQQKTIETLLTKKMNQTEQENHELNATASSQMASPFGTNSSTEQLVSP
jgi:hypothetical protein